MEAKENGFALKLVSGFRSYLEQSNIWNNKATGKRVLLDDHGIPLEFDKLSKQEILFQILRWSALPGTSRHHWGTDFDVYDANALPSPDYQVQLTPQEVEGDGIFAPLHDWLDEKIKDPQFPFFRPYQKDLGGVAPERWHLSFRPVASEYLEKYSLEIFNKLIKKTKLELTPEINKHAELIYEKFVINVLD